MKTVLRAAALVLALLAGAAPAADAQGRRRGREGGARLVKFDWNCASPGGYPKQRLGRAIRDTLKRRYPGDDTVQGDRAFAFDLNADRRPEYFVPLVCGATGNCDWGVFALYPTRFLGVVNGQYLYVRPGAGRWPDIVAEGHMTAAEGVLGTYGFRRGRYAGRGGGYAVGDPNRWPDFENVPLRALPKRLEGARPACGRLGR